MANSSENIPVVKVDDKDLPQPELIWNEYKYRHELCWNLLFKITLVTATLSIIPYLKDVIIPKAEQFVIYTPLVGIGVAGIGGYRLYRELKLLDKFRRLHRAFQKKTYDEKYKDLFQEDLHKSYESNFTLLASSYMILLNILAFINFIMQLSLFYSKCAC